MWPFNRSKKNQQLSTGSWQNNIQPNPSLTTPSQQRPNRDIGPPPRMDGGGLTGGGSGRNDGYLGPPIPDSGGTTTSSYGGAPYPGSGGSTVGSTSSNDGVGATITPGPGDGTLSGRPPGDVWIQGGPNDNSRYVGPPPTIRDNNPLPPPPNPSFSGPGGSTTTSFSSTNTNATIGNTNSSQTTGNSGPTTLTGAENRNQNTLDNTGLTTGGGTSTTGAGAWNSRQQGDNGTNPFNGFTTSSDNKTADA